MQLYATSKDIIARVGKNKVIMLTARQERGATNIDEGVVIAAIEDGQGLVDSYLSKRVALPLAKVPRFVKTLTVDLAIYYLYNSPGNSADKDSFSVKLYDEAIKHLERFAKGETSLGLNIPKEPAENQGAVPRTSPNSAEITSEVRRCSRRTFSKLT
ncbi:MAG: DUF1320 domain-containing protein [Gammaproteobacteria bacterium]|nr:DUF1320 domain-containing protein [Gammaproteobacteria bacterium]